MKTLSALLLLVALVSCANPTKKQLHPAEPKLVLVLVGGNSESIHRGGIWAMYGGQQRPKESMLVVNDLSEKLHIKPEDVSVHYFSWTGDEEDHKEFLPGHLNWITGGSAIIQQWLPQLTEPPRPDRRIAIVGWSNGGATAYELSCDLARLNTMGVSLLITLDPVSWTTRPCEDSQGKPQRVAKTWINVYTRSSWFQRLRAGNIIAFFGRAWNDRFPPEKADGLYLLPGDHGDTVEMWQKKVLPSKELNEWTSSK